jgi:UDP-N-acetylmuramate--alanine ligase
LPPEPFAGRRLWFVGIGGAGMSGYAALARAWGAEVAGWDRTETPYLRHLDGVDVRISPEPESPTGWEVIVSTAYAGLVPGRSRADFLAELVALRDAIVVGGTHGKGTTAAMIAFVLDRRGLDPAFLIGAEVPQLGGNARAGDGWLVVEGDESDGTIFGLPARIAVVTNVELEVHQAAFPSRAELERRFVDWLARADHAVRGDVLEPVDAELLVPGEHNRRNAACALAALEHAGVSRAEALPVLREFAGTGRRFELRGERGGARIVDDYAHHPSELSATIAAAREQQANRVLVLFQPHLYSRTRRLALELGAALAEADAVCVTEIYRARETPVDGVSGKLVVDALAERRPGMRIGWAPLLEDAVRVVLPWIRPGDVVVTAGAGDVDRAVPLLLDALA